MGDSESQWQLVRDAHEEGRDTDALPWLQMAAEQNSDAQVGLKPIDRQSPHRRCVSLPTRPGANTTIDTHSSTRVDG